MAGFPPIGIVIAEKVQLYKRKHCTERNAYECDLPVPVTDWHHPARRVTIRETTDLSYATQIYTDGSKIGRKVEAGGAIYTDKRLVSKCKYKLQYCCSNNQAEQIAILKSLELLPTLEDHNTRSVAIYTDSKVTLDSLKNSSIHRFLTEEIRSMLGHLTMLNWTIHFGWVKAHTRIGGNEVADKLAQRSCPGSG